jgi:hypothetical protein
MSFLLPRDAPYFILGHTIVRGASQVAQLNRALAETGKTPVPTGAEA